MLRNVYLEGELGNKFIPHFEIDCDTPAAAIRCIDANFPDFKQYMLQKGEEGVMYHLDVAGHEIEYGEELLMEMKEGDITLVPVPAGSKSGIGKLLLAAVIITAAFYMPTLLTYTQPLAVPGATTAAGVSGGVTVQGSLGAAMSGAMGKTVGVVANMAVGMATNLAIAGLQQIMAPDPSTDADQEQSYLFNGSEQNIVEGDPVPI